MKTNTFLRAVVAAVAVMVMAFSPVAAVTDGELDGEGHPYVGIMVGWNAAGEAWRCSGTLISPTVYLTAGHCTAGAVSVELWFTSNVEAGITPDPNDVNPNGYPVDGEVSGVAHTYPEYTDSAFYLYDVGVVVLDEAVIMDEYGALPGDGELDYLQTQRGLNDMWFTAVGYGLQASFPDAASWQTQDDRIRMVSYPTLIQINNGIVGDYSLLLSNNAHTGGTCFGDSGGPNFMWDTNVIAGVTSFGMNGNCAGTGGVFRLDKAEIITWVEGYL